jgi:predicted component of type VI protein secretion system
VGRLSLLLADGSSLDIPLDRERITIGRRADNDICLPYPAVSGEHAAVVTILEDSFLEDLNSTNGTLVNDNRIAKHFLRDGDRIDIGRQQLVYHHEALAKPPRDDAAPRSGRTLRPAARSDAGETGGPAVDAAAAGPAATSEPASPPGFPSGSGGYRRTGRGGADSALGALADALQRARRGEPASGAGSSTDEAFPDADEVDTSAGAAASTATEPVSAPAQREAPAAARPRAGAVRKMERPVLAEIHVTSGARAGTVLPVTADETLIGRVGERIVAVRCGDGVFRLIPLEGGSAVTVNGNPLDGAGSPLVPGDVFEVAGVSLRFALPAAGPA